MLGGHNHDHNFIKSVYTYLMSALLQSCVPILPEAKIMKTSSVDKADTWRQMPDLPVTEPTCESFNG